MLPQTGCESNAEAAQAQANYLILRTLQSKIPQQLFAQLLTEIQKTIKLPHRVTWDGRQETNDYSQLCVSHSELDDSFLGHLMQQTLAAARKDGSKLGLIFPEKSLSHHQKYARATQDVSRRNLACQLRDKSGHYTWNKKRAIQLYQARQFKRMKTVFCHADFEKEEISSVFNVSFDRTGHLLVSGADDGIVKVWDRDTLTLQASLHGHSDYITDVDISKCNRYLATASKDARIVIWDLLECKMIKRFTRHTNLINRIQFFTVKSKKDQSNSSGTGSSNNFGFGEKNSQISSLPTGSIKEHNNGTGLGITEDQYLISCSDDGTVRLYDFNSLNSIPGANQTASQEESTRIRRSARRMNDNSQQQRGISQPEENDFELELTPEDYRPGSRNKKIDSVCLNSEGLLVAGTHQGDLIVWKLNPLEIKRRNKQLAAYCVGTYRIHKESITYCEFSPVGQFLMTGSADGSAKIWNVALPKTNKREELSKVFILCDEDKERMLRNIYDKTTPDGQQLDKLEKVKSLCDKIKWSCKARYAIVSITTSLGQTDSNEFNRIKIWDSVTNTLCTDLATMNGLPTLKNTWVIMPHPTIEEIMVTGSEGGLLVLWNIKTQKVLQKMLQYGVYSIDKYTMDTPLDGQFSPDGKAFIVGSQLGTISLFSCEDVEHQYEATRVHQFFAFDTENHTDNPYDKADEIPQLCSYNMIPYEIQPLAPIIGKFRQKPNSGSEREQMSYDFQRNQVVANEMGAIEEKFYNDQLAQCLDDQFFQTGQNLQVLEQDDEGMIAANSQGGVLPADSQMEDQGINNRSIMISSISAVEHNNQNMTMNGISEMRNIVDDLSNRDLSHLNQQDQDNNDENQRRRLRRNNNGPSQSRRTNFTGAAQAVQRSRGRRATNNRTIIEDSSADGGATNQRQGRYDRSDEEDFQITTDKYSNENMSSELDEESFNEDDYDDEFPRKRRREDFRVNRQNDHLRLRQEREEEHKRQLQNQRAARAARRGEQRQGTNDSAVRNSTRNGRQERANRRNQRNQSNNQDSEMQIEEEEEALDYDAISLDEEQWSASPDFNAKKTKRSAKRVIDSDDEEEKSEKEYKNKSSTNRSKQNSNDQRRGRGRPRKEQPHSSSSMMQRSSSRVSVQRGQQSSSRNKTSKFTSDEQLYNSDEQMNGNDDDHINNIINKFSARSQASFLVNDTPISPLNNELIQGTVNALKNIDEDFEFISNHNENITSLINGETQATKVCAICNRQDQLVGPFRNKNSNNQDNQDKQYYFHRDCIEVSCFSFFRRSDCKWVNLGAALEHLVNKKSYNCDRCHKKGASIQCQSCTRKYHGHICSSMYMIPLENLQVQQTKPATWECLFCRNNANFEIFTEQKDKKLSGKEISRQYKYIPRDTLLIKKQTLKYVPQKDDLVYYFFQGHEYYINQYNCFFFCGEEEHIKYSSMPWIRHKELIGDGKNGPCLIRIVDIEHLFPSGRALDLVKRYPAVTKVQQKPQIISRLHCQIIGSNVNGSNKKQIQNILDKTKDSNNSFIIDLLDNDLPDFLVLKPFYEHQLKQFSQIIDQKKLLNQVFKDSCGNQIKIVRNQPLEATLYPQSQWNTIHFMNFTNNSISCNSRDRSRRRAARGRQNDANTNIEEDYDLSENIKTMNFWDIQFQSDKSLLQVMTDSYQGFEPHERLRILDTLITFMNKKKEYSVVYFKERVTDQIASDYRCVITAEMFLDLIVTRLENEYYRSQEQLFFDLDLISYNAITYNGKEHDIADQAVTTCEMIRTGFLKQLDSSKRNINLIKLLRQSQSSIDSNKQIMKHQSDLGIITIPEPVAPKLSEEHFQQVIQNNHEQIEEEVKEEVLHEDLQDMQEIEEININTDTVTPSIKNNQPMINSSYDISINLTPEKDNIVVVNGTNHNSVNKDVIQIGTSNVEQQPQMIQIAPEVIEEANNAVRNSLNNSNANNSNNLISIIPTDQKLADYLPNQQQNKSRKRTRKQASIGDEFQDPIDLSISHQIQIPSNNDNQPNHNGIQTRQRKRQRYN